jgi:hypothetical protein
VRHGVRRSDVSCRYEVICMKSMMLDWSRSGGLLMPEKWLVGAVQMSSVNFRDVNTGVAHLSGVSFELPLLHYRPHIIFISSTNCSQSDIAV